MLYQKRWMKLPKLIFLLVLPCFQAYFYKKRTLADRFTRSKVDEKSKNSNRFSQVWESRLKRLQYEISLNSNWWFIVVPDFAWKAKSKKKLKHPNIKFLPVLNERNQKRLLLVLSKKSILFIIMVQKIWPFLLQYFFDIEFWPPTSNFLRRQDLLTLKGTFTPKKKLFWPQTYITVL